MLLHTAAHFCFGNYTTKGPSKTAHNNFKKRILQAYLGKGNLKPSLYTTEKVKEALKSEALFLLTKKISDKQ